MAYARNGHITDDILDAYSLGQMSEADLAPVEEHLLTCPDCQDRLQATDLFVATIRHVLREPGVPHDPSQDNGPGHDR